MIPRNATARAAPDDAAERFRRQLRNPLIFRSFLLAKLPLAWFAGLRLRAIDEDGCSVVVPRGWRTQNPFASTYFAAQCMAAELSTGALAMAATRAAPVPVSMLVVDLQADLGKKATADATFVCDAGSDLACAVRQAVETGEPAVATVESVGRMADGTEVARFRFTWSFKRKQ
jgi:hypothetical protein